jgi:hypothetical protein
MKTGSLEVKIIELFEEETTKTMFENMLLHVYGMTRHWQCWFLIGSVCRDRDGPDGLIYGATQTLGGLLLIIFEKE